MLNILIFQILEAFHHPYYATGQSRIQNTMFEEMERWLGGLGEDEARQTIEALTKVRCPLFSPVKSILLS